MKKFLLSVLAILLIAPLVMFAQSTDVPIESQSALVTFLASAKGIVSFLIVIAIGLMTSGIKTPISFSVLTYVVNILQGILAFIQKILPDDLALDGSSHINRVKAVVKVSAEQDK
jgi:hypothetical protein